MVTLRHLCCTMHLLLVLCGHLAHAATDAGLTSKSPLTLPTNSSPRNTGTFSPTTSAPGGTEEKQEASEPTGTPEAATQDPLSSTASTTVTLSDAPTTAPPTTVTASDAPLQTTAKPIVIPEVCLCDLTPDFCDIGCCCDAVDCGVLDLRTVFTGCPEKPISGVCIEKWLMFKANVDPSLVTVTDSLFCIQPAGNATGTQTLPALSQNPAVLDSYHFSPPQPTTAHLHTRDFYRVDDVILTYFNKSSVRGLLCQPSPGPASSSCINRNPAKFLRSVSLSCTRVLTPQSCATDPSLSARSYFSGLSLIKLPVSETVQVTSDLLIPVSPMQSDWPTPREQNGSCLNVVSQVEFVIGYTSRGELTYATVNVVLAVVDANQVLSQKHSVQFQLATPRPTPGGPIPAVGLRVGSPVIGRFGEVMQPLTVLGVSRGGACSTDPSTRAPILFTHNSVTGCTFSARSSDCSELRSQLYGILQGRATPDLLAMSSGLQPDWTRVITQDCPAASPQETCESGCVLPRSLSIQVLWARQGPLDLPHNYILGAKYLFHCHKVTCPFSSSLAVTTEVMFVDTTVYPVPPRGLAQPDWKFPFGFFSRGAPELDGQTASNAAGDLSKVTCSALSVTVMMLTGLELFAR